jgi:hypothetical protein
VPAVDLRPLSTGELLDKTFSLYRSHFILFVGIMALPGLFLFILTLALELPAVINLPVASDYLELVLGLGVIVFGLAYAFSYAMALAATVYAVSEVYLGRDITIRDAYTKVRGRGLRILWMLIVLVMAMGIGFLLFVVPGVLVAVWYAVAIPAAIVENLKTRAAFRRSQILTKGRRGSIFLMFVLFLLLNYVAFMLFGFPAAFLMGLWPGVTTIVINNLATFISGAVAGPLLTIGLSLMYYDLRVRKEGFDLQLMLAALDPNPSTPPPHEFAG